MPISTNLPAEMEDARKDAERWRLKLEELKRTAEGCDTLTAREGIMRLVESYGVMARRAERKIQALERDARAG